MPEYGKREFEGDYMSLSDGGNLHAHVNDEGGGSHGTLTCESKKPHKAHQHSRAKVKTGCNTCKARRVKCDETKPVCRRCQKLRSVCDGYPASNEPWNPETHMIAAAVSASGMSANNELYDTGKSPLADERDYGLKDTTPKLPSIWEQLPEDDSGRVSQVHIEKKSPSRLETNHTSKFQRFRLILAKQARIVLVVQRFFKLMRAHSIVDSYSAVDQAKPDIFEIVSSSSDNNLSNEISETSPNILITTSGDIESDTNGTDYDSDDLPDDPELSVSAEERITNPKAYFDKLKSLEQQVFNNSGIFIHKTGDSTGPAQDEALLCLPAPEYYNYQTDYCLDIIRYSDSELLLDILVCHNRAHWAGNNLTVLQENGYCAKHISLLVQDQRRAEVVRVIQIEIQTILDLVGAFKEFMGIILVSFVSGPFYNSFAAEELDRLIEDSDNSLILTQKCLEILSIMSISTLPDRASRLSDGFVWQLTTQVIELAILSYAGAHIQPFDAELVEKESPSFHIPQRFKYHDNSLNGLGVLSGISNLGGLGVELCRRQLQCMDGFLGGKQPWVFHSLDHGSPNQQTRLCLSSTIEALTDLWGPSWRIMQNSSPNEIKQYDIGNGGIIPWTTQNGDNDTYLVPINSEVFCHWIPFKSWNEKEVDANQESLPRQHFLSSDILLIGAPNNYGLLVNEKCIRSPERVLRIKSRLSDQQALRSPNTSRARRYVDSHAIQIQGSAMGFISGAGQVTYKRRIGHTMKDALVERWRHGLRNPLDLEAYSGVEVSLCSRNARRRRLLNILASDTMVNYLRAISFTWDNGICESSYLKALRCPKSFRKIWKAHKDWQANIGDAISKCLDALEETGIDEDNQELSAFWVESFDADGDSDGEDDDDSIGQPDSIKNSTTGGGIQSPVQNNIATGLPTPPNILVSVDLDTCKFFEEWIVTLFRSEHTWTGFLEDSEESLTMVVVGKECLDFHNQDGFGRCCSLTTKTKGYPVLQTSLQINESLLSNCSIKLKQEKVDSSKKPIWNAHELKRGTTFCLGNHGTLEVISGSSKLCPTVVEWKGVKGGKSVGGILKEVKNVGVNENLLGKSVEKHHKEFIRGCWEVKPLPILVLSKSTKVRFGKE
ncbi:putative transcription factor cys6 protein [Botrytis fragariae]|uniref:Putative transcription factor cys6 protein n=1 Tax=Botrytis fragariae TaxID=1964551 RepID=A0A8H6B0X1_9HELO|nr:putative transcription factor cys6 protein [Botrytis fragariae]KAF5877105.1 putative transcription factor cys6 protein [Botrytis fragariae]